jgi:hypothetical protein
MVPVTLLTCAALVACQSGPLRSGGPTETPTPTTSAAELSPTPSASPTPTPTPHLTPSATGVAYSTDPQWLLLRMTVIDQCAGWCGSRTVMFALYGDGRAVFRRSPQGQPQMVQLNPSQVSELLGWAIGAGGGLTGFKSEVTFAAVDGVDFDIRTPTLTRRVSVLTPLAQLVDDDTPAHAAVARLARRLLNFSWEMNGRTESMTECAVTPTTRAAWSADVAWNRPMWQDTGADVWLRPVGALAPGSPPLYVGFPSDEPEFALTWLVGKGDTQPLNIRLARVPDGVGVELVVNVVVEADPKSPSTRRERESTVSALPPGCYEFAVDIAGREGSVVEQVKL